MFKIFFTLARINNKGFFKKFAHIKTKKIGLSQYEITKNSNYATFKFFFSFEHSDLLKLLIRLIQKMGGKTPIIC